MPDQKNAAEKDRFFITYNIKHHENGIAKEDVPPEHGASDCLLIMSKLVTEEGGDDYAFLGLDGATGDNVSPEEVFKAWVILANMLKDNLAPGDIRRDLCMDVLNIVYQAFDNADKKIELAKKIITSDTN